MTSQQESDDLTYRLQKWLEEQGYPLELRVARAFASRFRVFPAEYYADPVSGEYREIDLCAHIQKQIGKILFRVLILVECKCSPNKPWILFCSPDNRLAPPAKISQRAASKYGKYVLSRIANQKEMQRLPLFDVPQPSAYSVTQAFTSGQDVPYKALLSACNAVRATMTEADNLLTLRPPDYLALIAFPVVVLQGRLFRTTLSVSGSVETDEVDAATLLWRNPVTLSGHTIVRILTEPAVPKFVEEANESIKALVHFCESDLAQQFETLQFG